MAAPVSLTDLPTYVIIEILRYLDATSLYFMSRTSSYMDEVVRSTAALWRRIDARRAPNDRRKFQYCLDRCTERTHMLLTRADHCLDTLIPYTFFSDIAELKNLVVLALENQEINGYHYSMSSFPSHLHELSLKRSVVTNVGHFFRDSSDKLVRLRVLLLDECLWVTSSAFMPISKYRRLEILSVYKCKNLDNSIAYLSLSGRGFKRLKILDARLSPLGNTLIGSLYKSRSLLGVYLQNEDISYKLDYFKRKLALENGAPSRDYLVVDSEFDAEDSLEGESGGMVYENPYDLDDRGLLEYVAVYSKRADNPLPHSILYLDPYNPCTCGFEERQKKLKDKPDTDTPGDPKNGDDNDSDDQGGGGGGGASKLADVVSRLSRIVRRSQTEPGYNRGLTNNNNRRLNTDVGGSSLTHNGDLLRAVNEPQWMFNLMDRNSRSEWILDALADKYTRGAPDPDDENVWPASTQQEAHWSEIKRPRRPSSEPGPSGLNEPQAKKAKSDAAKEANSDSEEEVGSVSHERPPTPHPDANSPPPEKREAYRRIYFGHWPVIQIDNLQDIRKEFRVPMRRLSLRGYRKITNLAMDYISDLELEVLDLTYTSVTVDGINNYLVDHPFCRIVHERFCVCPPNLHF